MLLGTAAVLGLVDRQVPGHGVPCAVAAVIAFFELLLEVDPLPRDAGAGGTA